MATGAVIGAASLSATEKLRQAELEAAASIRNANRLKETSKVISANLSRKERIFEKQGQEFQAQTAGSFAKAGVDFSGSVLNKLAQNAMNIEDELMAIRFNADVESNKALSQANELILQADTLRSTENKLSILGRSALSAYSNFRGGS